MEKLGTLLLMCLPLLLSAQRPGGMPQKITLSGTIIDNDTQQPLEYATITFQNPQRPNMLQGGITDANGKFEIEIFPGRYTLKAEYISFEPYTKELAPYRENQDLGVIGLSISDNALEEVQVMGERTEVEFRLDKRIYNVGRDITVRGGSVADVLDNVPSVSVDIDGNVALRGNDNVRILINGKPSGLVGISGPEGLRQLPAESIEKVEVVTSPSARYDAEGTAGILNIILKKEELEGVNGTFSANVGTPKNNRASANLNWRTKKVNIFTTNTFSDNNNNGRGYDDNVYFNGAAPDTYLEEIDESNRGRKSFFSRLGLEYYINDKSSVIFSGFYRNSDGENNSLNEIRELGANRDVYSFTTRENLESELDESLQYSIDYTNKFDDKGHELTARFQYEESNEDEQSQIEAKGFLPTVIPSSFETVGNLEFQKRMLMQADYVWPIDENTQFELGYRGNFNTQETDYEVAYLNNGIPTIDRDLSNVLVYKEFVNAAYSQYGKKINNFSFLFGLRMEHSNIQIDQRTTNDYTQKKYTDWFPTANFSYEINERESVTLGLSRRLRRPRSRFINPFPSRSSITNLFMGNPDLNPTYTGNLDFGYLKRWEKYTFNGSVYYQKSTSVFTFVNLNTGETVVISGDPNDPNNPEVRVPVLKRFPINLSENNRLGIEMNLTYTPNRSVRLNGNFNFFNSTTIGSYEGRSFDATNISWFARMNASIRLPKKYNLQVRGFYRGPSETAQSRSQGFYVISGAINKEILNDKGSLSLRLSDFFNTGRFRNETFTDTFISYTEYQRRIPTYILSFTYRLNQKKNQRPDRRNMQPSEDEGDFEY